MQLISRNLYQFRDTCHVYLVRSGDSGVLVDFGDGGFLQELAGLGIRNISDILITHHHRDQCQGLSRALAAGNACLQGARVWAPFTEQHLFHSVDAFWQSRPILNNYDVRQDRFSLLEPLLLNGTLKDYETYTFSGLHWEVLPAPGHTPGSVALLVEVDGQLAAFTGDLIAGPGKVWSLAALQWSYQKMEGAAAMVPVLRDLCQRRPDLLLPSHGEVITDAQTAIDLLLRRLRLLLDSRQENTRLDEWLERPYEAITPHLLHNRTSVSNSYVLLSRSGKALFIDYGYDFVTGNFVGPDRSLHRPWLVSLPGLKRDFGVKAIDAVIPTHYHDDHVAGCNLLRQVEGAQVWAAEPFAQILREPNCFDLPCLWYDPIAVDQVLPVGQKVVWEEYALELFQLPGHTRYAVAIAFMVDGKRVLATGDQHKGDDGLSWNYVYQNRFEPEDYRASAELYARLAPDLILPGHWQPLWTTPEYFRQLRERGETLLKLHRDLLPEDSTNIGPEGFAARIQPYFSLGWPGQPLDFQVEVRNPLPIEAVVSARFVLPEGWCATDVERHLFLVAGQTGTLAFTVIPPAGASGPRFRLSVDLTANQVHLGQQAEALVDLVG